MKLRATNKRLLVKLHPVEERRGSLIVVQAGNDQIVSGDVVSVGDEVAAINVGDSVWFNRFNAFDIPTHQIMAVEAAHILAFKCPCTKQCGAPRCEPEWA